ncbi:DUF536 domain-containing protein [Liquorilactobacillus mali]|uniref:Regulator of chromosome segregation-like C-terminal domain-containing protein n=1 Tax=Liquorilactobacillus mali KCTC 3596 = DSM 20444 TaxID=1046596 RepID=J0UTE8_9LACO|nr:DUF536 domain-containing protein [Liquorilactobacillus mali]EJF00687.1 hypothetical protein LMA_03044 [Liquorilactobacillus mali KCTC 3596 = DSM 20444]KRN08939.1 hypothetical protein FD00_GL001647 [Liquorilactobacillus mali KCTC 3596 = DSM 20444]MDC7954076.1 DUF536 domain-containing protein [Liquorilactobacillus mali]QFQ75726.1 DUF536 domain-containing protein [Liquorilactobacillus mali]
MAKKWLSVPEIAEELGINKLRVYRYINKYSIDYDKRLKNVNYYGEPIVKRIKEHFLVAYRIGDTRDTKSTDMPKTEKSNAKPATELKNCDTKERVSEPDSNKEEIKESLENKGKGGENIAIQPILEDYREQFKLMKEQLKKKDEQLATKDEQLSKVYKLLDQQQQLELGTQKRLKTLESGNDLSEDKAEDVEEELRKEPKTAERPKKRHWWQRR